MTDLERFEEFLEEFRAKYEIGTLYKRARREELPIYTITSQFIFCEDGSLYIADESNA